MFRSQTASLENKPSSASTAQATNIFYHFKSTLLMKINVINPLLQKEKKKSYCYNVCNRHGLGLRIYLCTLAIHGSRLWNLYLAISPMTGTHGNLT